MRTMLASAVAIVMWTVGVWAQQAPAPALTTAAISGVVKDGATGQPLTGVVLELRAPSTGAPLARITRQITDERGRYVFRDLAAGRGYVVTAVRPGYIDGGFGQSAAFGPTGGLELSDGEWFASAHITLWKPAAISGRVVDEANEPVVGAYVRALARVTIAGAPQLLAGPATQTDDRGEYRIAGLGAGHYVIMVPSPSATVPGDAPMGVLGAPAPPLQVDPITRMSTAPRTNALLDPVNGHRVVTGNHLTPPPRSDAGARVYTMAFHPGVATVEAAPSVTVALGEERSGVDVALRPVSAVNVFGRVSAPPEGLKGLLLRLVPVGLEGMGNGAEAATSLVAGDGTFAFLMVAPGDYVIDAPSSTLEFTIASAGPSVALPQAPGLRLGSSQSASMNTGPPGAGYVRRSGPRSEAFFTRTPVSVGDRDVRDFVVTLEETITLTGRIEYEGSTKVTVEQTPVVTMGASGRTPTNTTVTEVTTPRPSTQPTIVAEPAFGLATLGIARAERPSQDDPQDRITLPGLRSGAYVFRVTTGAARYIVKSITVDGVDCTRKPLDTTTLTARSELVITLTDKLIEFRGTVSEGTGPAAEGAVLVFPAERAEWRGYGLTPQRLKAAPLAGSGAFVATGLPAGDYLAVAVPNAHMSGWQDPAFLEKMAALATPVTLSWGETRLLDLRMVRVP